MEAETKKISSSRIEILFNFEWEEFSPYLDKACSLLTRGLKIPGFRPNKIPLEIAEREIGQDKILTEAGKLFIEKKYSDYIVEEKLEVIGHPEVKILKLAFKNPFSFKIEVDVLPEINLPDYKKIVSSIEKEKVSVNEKEIEEALEFLRKSRAIFKNLDREAKKNDFLEIEYNSPQIENNKKYQDRFLLGEGHFVPDFENNLYGLKPKEKKDFSVKFPDDFNNKTLAGKKIDFKIEVKKVQSMKTPELSDEFAKTLGSFKNLEELKKSIKDGITQEKEFQETQKRRERLLAKISEETNMEIPPSLISIAQNDLMKDLKENVKNNLKIPFEKYLLEAKKTEEELKEGLKNLAKEKVKKFLILNELGKREKVEIKNEEIESAVNDFLKNYPEDKEAKNKLDINKLKEYYKSAIYNQKVMQLLTKASPKDDA